MLLFLVLFLDCGRPSCLNKDPCYTCHQYCTSNRQLVFLSSCLYVSQMTLVTRAFFHGLSITVPRELSAAEWAGRLPWGHSGAGKCPRWIRCCRAPGSWRRLLADCDIVDWAGVRRSAVAAGRRHLHHQFHPSVATTAWVKRARVSICIANYYEQVTRLPSPRSEAQGLVCLPVRGAPW